MQLRLVRICVGLCTRCIRHPDGPALFGNDLHIAVQRQVAIFITPSARTARQQDNVAVSRVLHRAVPDGKAIVTPDLEHHVAAAGQRMPVQIQRAGVHIARHHQPLRTQVHVPQQRHHRRAIPRGHRILQRGGVASDTIVVYRLGHERLLALVAVVACLLTHIRVGAGVSAFARAFHQRVLMRRHNDVVWAITGATGIHVDIRNRGIGRRRPRALVIRALYERRSLRQPCTQRIVVRARETADQHIAHRHLQRLVAVVAAHIHGVLAAASSPHHRYYRYVLAQYQRTMGLRLDGRRGGVARAALLDRAVLQRHHRLMLVRTASSAALTGDEQHRACLAVRQVRRPGVAAQVDGDLRVLRVDAHVLRPVLRQQDRAFPRLALEDSVHRRLNAAELLRAVQQHVALVAAFAHAVGVLVRVRQHLHVLQLGRAHLLQYGVRAVPVLAVERVPLRQQRTYCQVGAVFCIDFDLLERTVLQLGAVVIVNDQAIHRHIIVGDTQRTGRRRRSAVLAQIHIPQRTLARDGRRTPGDLYGVHSVAVQVDGASTAHPRGGSAVLKQRHTGVEEVAAAVHCLHIPRLAVIRDPRRELRIAVLAHARGHIHRPVLARHHAHVGHRVSAVRVIHKLAARVLERVPLRQQVAGLRPVGRVDPPERAAAQAHRPAAHIQLPDLPDGRIHRQRPAGHIDHGPVERTRALLIREVQRASLDVKRSGRVGTAAPGDGESVQVQRHRSAARDVQATSIGEEWYSLGVDRPHKGVPQQRHRIRAVFLIARRVQRIGQPHVVRRVRAVRHAGRQRRLADAAGIRLGVHLPVPVQTRHAAEGAHAVTPVCAVDMPARFAAGADGIVRVAASLSHIRVRVGYDAVVTRSPVVRIGNLQQRRALVIVVALVRQPVVAFQQLAQVAISGTLLRVDGAGLRFLVSAGKRAAYLQSAPQLRGVLHRQAALQMHRALELQHAALGQYAGLSGMRCLLRAALGRQHALKHQRAAGEINSGPGVGGGAGGLDDRSVALDGQRAAVDYQRVAGIGRQLLAVHIQRDGRLAAVERHLLGHVLPQLHPFDAAVLGRRLQRALQRAVDVALAVDDHGLHAAAALAVAFNVMLVLLDSYVFQGRPAGIHRDSLDVIGKTERIPLGQQVHQRGLVVVVFAAADDFRERAAADGEAAAVGEEVRHTERAALDDDAAAVFAPEIRIADGHIFDVQRAADRPVDPIIITITIDITIDIAAGSDCAAAPAFEIRHIGVGNIQRTGLEDQPDDSAGLVRAIVHNGQIAGDRFFEDEVIIFIPDVISIFVDLIHVPAHDKVVIVRRHPMSVQVQRERPGDVCAVRYLHILPQRHRAVLLPVGVGDGVRERGVIGRCTARRHLHGCFHAANRARTRIPALAVVVGAGIPAIAGLAVDDAVPVRHHGHGYFAVALAGRVCIGHIVANAGHGIIQNSAAFERRAAGQTVRQLHGIRYFQYVGQRCTCPKGQRAALQVDRAGHAANDNGIHRHAAAGDHKAVPFPDRGHTDLCQHAVFQRHLAAADGQRRSGIFPRVAAQVDDHFAGGHSDRRIRIPRQRYRAALTRGSRLDGRLQIGILHPVIRRRQRRAAFTGVIVLRSVGVAHLRALIVARVAERHMGLPRGDQPEVMVRRFLISAVLADGYMGIRVLFFPIAELVLSRHRRAAVIARPLVLRGVAVGIFEPLVLALGEDEPTIVAIGRGGLILYFHHLHRRADAVDGQFTADKGKTKRSDQLARAALLHIDVQCRSARGAKHFNRSIHRQRCAVAENKIDGFSTDNQTIIDGHVPRHHVPFIVQLIIIAGQFRSVRADLLRAALADVLHRARSRHDLRRPLHAACLAFALYGQRIAFLIRVLVAVGQQNICQIV